MVPLSIRILSKDIRPSVSHLIKCDSIVDSLELFSINRASTIDRLSPEIRNNIYVYYSEFSFICNKLVCYINSVIICIFLLLLIFSANQKFT